MLRELFMRKLRQFLLVVTAGAFVLVVTANAQDDDAPSLGDVARQSRQQKQQKDAQAPKAIPNDTPAKDAQTKDAQGKAKDKQAATANEVPASKTSHVITNEEIPEHIGPTRTRPKAPQNPDAVPSDKPAEDNGGKTSAEDWQSQIMAQKSAIANLKSDIESLSASIEYAGANCVSGCVEWNERQKQKQDQVESMKVQLAEQEKRLEDMQESARKQGYGSSVYDP